MCMYLRFVMFPSAMFLGCLWVSLKSSLIWGSVLGSGDTRRTRPNRVRCSRAAPAMPCDSTAVQCSAVQKER